ncbi:MAG TPA: acetate--CoA ligase family protein [Gemmatimonadales bacterium]|jgi:acetyl coenzyme A synthetase (ADP forming)-like protein
MSSLDPILRPQSIAVIGASRQPNTIGWQILHNLLNHGFQGPVYPVNPKARAIHSIQAYPSISAVPGPVDLALVVVPKQHVLKVVLESVAAGVRGLVIISAGFKEVGGEGVERERELLDVVRTAGIRMVGPNCMGVMNTNPGTSMNATFAPGAPPTGPIALVSQSGAMGVSILDYAQSLGIGISAFVSSGNKADVSGNDLLEYWRDDDDIEMVLMYLEGFGNPVRFVELGRTMTRTKPVCVVKSGRTGAGARAAASHTGALAGTELVTEAIIAQAGAIRADTVQELFDFAMAFSNQPLPPGNRVAIVTNAGGPGIIIADACEAHGLAVTSLTEGTEAKLRSRLPEEASVHNPVDLIASANGDAYEFALCCVLDDPQVDAAIAAFVPPLGIQTAEVAAAIVRANAGFPDKPILAVLMGREGLPAGVAELQEARIPAYIFPESAARALAAMWRQREAASRPVGKRVQFATDDDGVGAIIDRTLAAGATKVSEADAMRVLEAYGVPVLPWHYVGARDSDDVAAAAAAAAEDVGLPVAVKIVSPQVVHKTEVGGVALGLETADAVRDAVRSMLAQVATAGPAGGPAMVSGFVVQQMASRDGIETIVGLTRAPRVGPLVMFGMGGIYVEVMKDVVLRLAPLLDSDADDMMHQVKLYRLLEGVRGQAPRDRQALASTILRIGQLAVRHPRIVEMDINPLMALDRGVVAIDVRIQLDG